MHNRHCRVGANLACQEADMKLEKHIATETVALPS